MGIGILDASKHMWLKSVFILTLILLCIKLKNKEESRRKAEIMRGFLLGKFSRFFLGLALVVAALEVLCLIALLV